MVHNEKPFSKTEEILFPLLAMKLSSALRNMVIISGLYKNSFKQYMKSYFNTKHTEESKLYASLEEWGGQRGDRFICYKVKASDINQEINAEYICSIFENALAPSISFWYDSILLVIVDVTQSKKKEEKIHEKMRDLLNKLHLKAGVSLPFSQLPLAWYCFRQACCAFEEGYPLDEEETLYFFQDYVGKYMLNHATGEFPVRYLMDKGLQNISDHDKLYSVSYMDTLAEFFRCGMNMSKTAEALGIHRTSLNSRMMKIRECLSHEMDQPYLLYLQIMIALLNK